MTIDTQNKLINVDFTPDKIQLLKNTICKGSTDDEFELFRHVCQRTGLDPFRNQIYAIKRKERMTIQTGIDGFRLIAERTGRYSPGKEASYVYDAQGKLRSATSYIKKQTQDGTWHEISATAFWSEYVQEYNGKPSNFWAKMPHTMLAKVAESICLRKAFPADFSGIYSTEEMGQADNDEKQIVVEAEKIASVKEEIITLPELTEEEIQAYLEKNYPYNKEQFRKYIDENRILKKWTYRKCIEMFDKYKEKVEKNFYEWLGKQDKA